MPVIPYTPEMFPLLREAAGMLKHTGLLHAPFVNYYYATREWCRLYLAVSENGSLEGTLGAESIELTSDGAVRRATFGSNYYSCRPGGSAAVTRKILRSAPLLLTYGGSADTHRILKKFRYVEYVSGVATYELNRRYDVAAGESPWKSAAKWVLRNTTRLPLHRCAEGLPDRVRKGLSVREEAGITADMLPAESPFRFRLAPNAEYLNWRFQTGLSFACYRVFRILSAGRTAGYAVLHDGRSRIVVAHCDGEHAETLAYGVLFSLVALGRADECPTVTLSSAHPAMQRIFEDFGFVRQREGRPFVLYGALEPLPVLPPCCTWLMNFEIGDNGLRPPFADQAVMVEHA